MTTTAAISIAYNIPVHADRVATTKPPRRAHRPLCVAVYTGANKLPGDRCHRKANGSDLLCSVHRLKNG